MHRTHITVALGLLVGLMLTSSGMPEAEACTTVHNRWTPPEQVESESDHTPPAVPEIVSVSSITRGSGETEVCGQPYFTSSNCDHYGFLQIALLTEDDTTPAGELGIELQFFAGDHPVPGFGESSIRPYRDGEVLLIWNDEATDDQEPLDFEVQAFAHDGSGNRSEASPRFRISHSGIPEERPCIEIEMPWNGQP